MVPLSATPTGSRTVGAVRGWEPFQLFNVTEFFPPPFSDDASLSFMVY